MLTNAPAMMSEVRWGIVGCGDVCAVKSGPALAKADGSSLEAVCRRNLSKAAEYAERHGVSHCYGSADEMLRDANNINAVYIATPPDAHLTMALKAAQLGLPTLLEKPMARCAAEAAVIAAAFHRNNVPLFVAYYRRALPRYVRARELLLSRVGPVRSVTVEVRVPHPGWCDKGTWRTERIISGGGLFVDVGSHVVDVLDWMLGPLLVLASHFGRNGVSSWAKSVQPSGGESQEHKQQQQKQRGDGDWEGVEDHVIFAFDLPLMPSAVDNVACFDFSASSATGSRTETGKAFVSDRISIVGEGGMKLSFPALGLPEAADRTIRLHDASGRCVVEEVVENPEHVHGPLIQTVVDELRGVPGVRCASTGDSGLRAAVVVDAALEWGKEQSFLRQQGFVGEEQRSRAVARVRELVLASGRSVG